MGNLEIRDVKVILTAPEGINLVVVKVETSEPGLYGLGCATFTQRYLSVAETVEQYMKPFLIGRDPRRIEDIWQTAMVSAYWRNGPVLNNAISGVDMALWDIKGKLAGMPVYELLGGKCREAAAVYRHADGRDLKEVEDNVARYLEEGYRSIRCQWGLYGGRQDRFHSPEGAAPGAYYDPDAYARSVPKLFEHIRSVFGYEVELIHDIHERVAPIEAIRLAKQLEPYRLFFLEDPLAPEDLDWFRRLRQASATPIAMGELFVHPQEWMPLIREQLIDFIRVHVSAIGGLTPARKLAVLCESFGVRTAWHGPGDVSPVGHAANLHLDLSSWNFGIQEWYGPSDVIREVFPGCPEVRGGYAYVNDKPGLGIDIDEKKAAKYPCRNELPAWTLARRPDGTAARP
ncbi:Enolase 2-phosphoglycerate dehydratase, Mandelate racemase/muconate lactonizing enzyme [Thermobacillus xylanilyticus]|uniref:Enolase 2-phosphoglycerate dehydratase, Mandelate racemase/muconate lactonizing enzyme n=1 Tax=Thermobacillus xylanilyticus TaxID=76633 RepID=A0ABN7RRQ0_THEXY|nr:enolase C-terminal domain-like protein [Thermobacillus xylanilyticus]CAG5081763.1 Enolase 2-phosphoglycerate dehydratase, Mandelate racemase/muconate lactonizing enzyme [Thermobacillus xylanilyticus]